MRADDASATPAHFPNQLTKDGGGELGKNVAIEDVLRLPKVPPGDYVLGFRCELRLPPPLQLVSLTRPPAFGLAHRGLRDVLS